MAHVIAVRPLPRLVLTDDTVHMAMGALALRTRGIAGVEDADGGLALVFGRQHHEPHEARLRMIGGGRGPHGGVRRLEPDIPRCRVEGMVVRFQTQRAMAQHPEAGAGMDVPVRNGTGWKGHLVEPQKTWEGQGSQHLAGERLAGRVRCGQAEDEDRRPVALPAGDPRARSEECAFAGGDLLCACTARSFQREDRAGAIRTRAVLPGTEPDPRNPQMMTHGACPSRRGHAG